MTSRKKPAAAKRRPASKTPGVAARLPKPSSAQVESARRKFEQGLAKRGEAVPEGEPLTPGATHTVGTDAQGKPVFKRKRFSLS